MQSIKNILMWEVLSAIALKINEANQKEFTGSSSDSLQLCPFSK